VPRRPNVFGSEFARQRFLDQYGPRYRTAFEHYEKLRAPVDAFENRFTLIAFANAMFVLAMILLGMFAASWYAGGFDVLFNSPVKLDSPALWVGVAAFILIGWSTLTFFDWLYGALRRRWQPEERRLREPLERFENDPQHAGLMRAVKTFVREEYETTRYDNTTPGYP
jgi:hypothetical protein